MTFTVQAGVCELIVELWTGVLIHDDVYVVSL